MSQIKLKHSGGNGVIIAAPSSNPAADRTLLLPGDGDSTIDTLDREGNILQVKQTVKSDTYSKTVSPGTTVFTGENCMELAFTPTKSTSKLLISGNLSVGSGNTNGLERIGVILKAGSSTITAATGDASSNRSRVLTAAWQGNQTLAQYCMSSMSFSYLHTVSNTNAVTYGLELVGLSGAASMTVYLNRVDNTLDQSWSPRAISTLTIQEVAV